MEEYVRNELVPMVLSAGAKSVQFIQTGELTSSVITQYADEAAATDAQGKIAEIRKKSAPEQPVTMVSAHGGAVIASGP
jgi:hypothetical protein